MDPRHILVIYPRRLGDLIVATPFLRGLRAKWPRARMRLVASWRNAPAAPLIPFIDETVTLGRPQDWSGHAKLLRDFMKAPAWDMAVDLNCVFSRTSSIFMWAARAEVGVGFDDPHRPRWLRRLYGRAVPNGGKREHMASRYRRLALSLELPYLPEPECAVPPDALIQAERLAPALFDGRPGFNIIIHPGNFKHFGVRWPEANYVTLSCRLLSSGRRDLRLCLLAGPGEREACEKIAREIGQGITLLPESTLPGTAAMLSRARLFVGSVTGTAHLAAAVGTPTFTFNSGYTYAVWRPLGERHAAINSGDWHSCREIGVDRALDALWAHMDFLQAASRAS
jgi:ADP-heptose:LPS heptosyltransferase